MIKDFIHKTILFIIGLCTLTVCDKNGKVLPSDFKSNCEINGEIYTDQMPTLLPPGVKRTPYVDLKMSGKRYIQFYSSLQRSGQIQKKEFLLLIFISIDRDFILEQKYGFQIGKNGLMPSTDYSSLPEGQSQYVVIRSSVDETWYSGEGFLEFTEFNMTALIAKGKFTFNFPYPPSYKEVNNLQLDGTFECSINTFD